MMHKEKKNIIIFLENLTVAIIDYRISVRDTVRTIMANFDFQQNHTKRRKHEKRHIKQIKII